MTRTGSKRFFAREREVHDWIEATRKKLPLWLVQIPGGFLSPAEVIGPGQAWTPARLGPVRLFLSSDAVSGQVAGKNQNDLDPFAEGWAMLDIGLEDETSLEMSSLAFKSDQPRAQKVFAQVKRELQKHLQTGVYGGEGANKRLLPGLAYSPGAAEAFRRGKRFCAPLGVRGVYTPADNAGG